MEINGVAVMRRRSDSWLNATQVLKVAGIDKGKRTKVLEKEVLTGEHEKVQGGYGKYQGTWINYRRGREFCRQYGVEDMLRPLLDYDVSSDGNGQGIETPTKEQAMAANRKRFYTAALDARANSQNGNGGTFFSNISATASNAIAAMNKVARMNSPAPRPGSAQRRPSSMAPRSSNSQPPAIASQDSFRAASQTSMASQTTDRSFQMNGAHDSAYGSSNQHGIAHNELMARHEDVQEPPRKRMRSSHEESSFHIPNGAEISMREGTPTEPSESFMYRPMSQLGENEWPTAIPPLPQPETQETEEKVALLLDLFFDLNRTDFTTHPAIYRLSGADLDLPLDQSANTALHWAATLARVPLMRLLISKGANMFRGNIAGQTPLMAAVQVKNCLDHSCFPELLEILSPLIELRDQQGRTVLHHIAVSCGIRGRAASSKYYLEALLEFLVRGNTSQPSSFEANAGMIRPMGLMKFMTEIVNARDRAGNTALNLVARIGNRSIIHQLLEIEANPKIANNKGLKPTDFGVGIDDGNLGFGSTATMSQAHNIGSPTKGLKSRVEETSKDMMPSK
jgi:regulatory protein SWI6